MTKKQTEIRRVEFAGHLLMLPKIYRHCPSNAPTASMNPATAPKNNDPF